jgi:hypothetical protein
LKKLLQRAFDANSRLRIAKRRVERKIRALGPGYPDWRAILGASSEAWTDASAPRPGKPRILIATNVGSHLPATSLESVLGAALTLRGAEVEILICDELLPACLAADATWYADARRFALRGPQADLCADCYRPAERMYRSMGFRVHRLSELLEAKDRNRAAAFARSALSAPSAARLDGLATGEHALAGALRFFARADLEGEPTGQQVLQRYLEASALSSLAARTLIRRRSYECVTLHHGIYVPQGPVAEAARAEGVRVVTWNPAYRKRCFVFSHGDTYHHTLLDEPVANWENLRLMPEQEKALMAYLESRSVGSYDWIWFHDRPNFDRDQIFARYGLRSDVPIIGLLTNVMWDAQLHYPANVFPGMLPWIIETIRYFGARPELQLLIRIHPAEIRGTLPSRQRVDEEIRKAFPALPPNVAIIPPESDASTYVAMGACDTVIIYGTKTGVELTSVGIPVIVAGEAWIRNKGVTIDPPTQADYFRVLDTLPLRRRMSEEDVARARRYAHHFFFRRMIPLEFMEPQKGWPPYRPGLKDLSPLLPGRSAGLDLICDGILTGRQFVFDS